MKFMQTKNNIRLAIKYSMYILSGLSVINLVCGLTCSLKHTNNVIEPKQANTALKNEFIGSKPFNIT